MTKPSTSGSVGAAFAPNETRPFEWSACRVNAQAEITELIKPLTGEDQRRVQRTVTKAFRDNVPSDEIVRVVQYFVSNRTRKPAM